MKSLSILNVQRCSTTVGAMAAAVDSRVFTYNFLSIRTITRTKLYSPCFISIRCSASGSTLSALGEEQKQTFGGKEAEALVKELRRSFINGKTKSYEWRVSQLKAIKKMVEEREKEIIEAVYQDLAKPETETFVAEISMVNSACDLALKELKQWMKPEKVKTSFTAYPSSAEIVAEPLGVALIISTWNFPFSLSVEPVIGAIAAGNAVVLKPSEIAPATSSLLTKLFSKYLDGSVVRVIEGSVSETSALLDKKWDKIFYTGSGRVGRTVMTAAAKHLTPVTLELGGKCPAIVDSNINLAIAARRIIAGKWSCNSGQVCIGVDYIITTKEFAPKLIDALRGELEKCYGKDPMQSRDMSRIVNSFHFKRLLNLLDENKVSDKIVVGGQRDENRLMIAPTILLDVPADTAIMQEEIFGPLLPIVTVEKLEDSFEIIKSRPKPLAAYCFTDNEQLKKAFVENVSAGGMAINDTILHITVAGLPFGGVGESGMGSYHGKFSFDTFSHKKGILYQSFASDAAVRYPPYTTKKLRILRAVIGGNIIGSILALIDWPRKNEKENVTY